MELPLISFFFYNLFVLGVCEREREYGVGRDYNVALYYPLLNIYYNG